MRVREGRIGYTSVEPRSQPEAVRNGYVVVESAKAQGQSFGNLGCDAGKEATTLITFESGKSTRVSETRRFTSRVVTAL